MLREILDLAERFDALPSEAIAERVGIAEQMRPLLGEEYEEFDRRYAALVDDGRGSARAALGAMSLVAPTSARMRPVLGT